MASKRILELAVLAAAAGASPLAMAGTVLAPVSAVSSIGSGDTVNYQPVRMIDQSGLSAGYVSGVTDFDSYVATTVHLHASFGLNNWSSPIGVRLGSLTFGLGPGATVDRLALWSDGYGISGIRDFTLLASATSDFASASTLGSFTAAVDVNGIAAAQVFAFAPTSDAFIRLQIDSVHRQNVLVTYVGEVAFRQVAIPAVPEPGAWALMLAGGGLLAAWGRRAARRPRCTAA